ALKSVGGEVSEGERDSLVYRQHVCQFLDGEETLEPSPRSDVLPRGNDGGHWHPLRPGSLEVARFLDGRRPARPRPESCQESTPPGKAIVPLQVDRQPPVALLEDQPASRAPLLGVEMVGDRALHDAIDPVWAKHLFPVGAAPPPPYTPT